MRVLEGRLWQNWSREVTCTHCTSRLLVEQKDLCYTVRKSGRGNVPMRFAEAQCPICQVAVSVDAIPGALWAHVPRKEGDTDENP